MTMNTLNTLDMNTANVNNKIIVMTGATSGLGKVAACELAHKGATVFVLCRSNDKGEMLQKEYHEQYQHGKGSIETILCNLSSFSSIVEACKDLHSKVNKVDIIINNAGIMNFRFKETEDHIEETWQVNLLAPMLISHLLIDLLSTSENAKIIFTVSALHQGRINFQDLESRKKFSGYKAYRQSKLGLILQCRYLGQKLAKTNISLYSQHPGLVRTSLGRDAGWFARMIFSVMGKSPQEGCKTLLYLVEADKDDLTTGEYYADLKITYTTKESYSLSVAGILFETVRSYLREYLTTSSPIFTKNEKSSEANV
jgi:NAD(P)-dependent dehydrogenase (short-subunit alcohol dehydrogenase family)